MKSAKKNVGYSAKDLREVSDSPELTEPDFAKARPFGDVFPDLVASIRRGKAPPEKLISGRTNPRPLRSNEDKKRR